MLIVQLAQSGSCRHLLGLAHTNCRNIHRGYIDQIDECPE